MKFEKSPLLRQGKIIKLTNFTQAELEHLFTLPEETVVEVLQTLNKTRNLSETILREFRDFIKFSDIAIWQEVSEPFIREFCLDKDDAMFAIIGSNGRITQKFEHELHKRFNK